MSTPLTEKCSLYKTYLHKEHGWCFSTKPMTVDIIDVLTKSFQTNLLTQVRTETNKSQRDILKRQLWGITPSSIQENGRGEDFVVEHTGLLCFDIDKYQGEPMTEEILQRHLAVIKNIPYTVYC